MLGMGSSFVYTSGREIGDQTGPLLSMDAWLAALGVSPLIYLPILTALVLGFALLLRSVLRQYAQRSLLASSTLQDITQLIAGIGGVLIGGVAFGSIMAGLLCGVSFILLCADAVALGRADAKQKEEQADQAIYSEALSPAR